MSYTPQEDEHPRKVPHTHSTQQLATPESRPHSHPLSPLASSSMGPSPRKVIPYVKPADLCPNGYSWFMRSNFACPLFIKTYPRAVLLRQLQASILLIWLSLGCMNVSIFPISLQLFQ